MAQRILGLIRRIARPFMGKGYGRLPVVHSIVSWIKRGYRPEYVEVEGRRVYLNPDDPEVSSYLALHGYFEKMETELIHRHVKPGMHVLDVGANIGYYTVMCSALVGRDGSVVAIEPDDANYAFLNRGVAELPEKNVHLVKAAAWSESGTLDLYLSSENPGDHQSFASDRSRQHYTVDAIRVDDLPEARAGFDFVKMDIQGAEGHALTGMRQTLERHPPQTMIVEFWPSSLEQAGTPPDEIYAFISGLGYDIRRISNEDGKLYPIQSYQDIRDFCDLDWKFMNLLCVRP